MSSFSPICAHNSPRHTSVPNSARVPGGSNRNPEYSTPNVQTSAWRMGREFGVHTCMPWTTLHSSRLWIPLTILPPWSWSWSVIGNYLDPDCLGFPTFFLLKSVTFISLFQDWSQGNILLKWGNTFLMRRGDSIVLGRFLSIIFLKAKGCKNGQQPSFTPISTVSFQHTHGLAADCRGNSISAFYATKMPSCCFLEKYWESG